MSRFLAIDWDHQHLQVIYASLKHGKVRVWKAAAWREERSPNPAEAEELGQHLRKRLKEAGIPAAAVLACVGRDRVILKEIRHPPVPPAEEAAVVRFQAVKELNDSPDDVVIDYVPDESAGERKALALVVRRELLQTYQTLCKAAGLKLVGLCPRPFGTAQCVPGSGKDAVAVLTLSERWAEFAVVRGRKLVLTRSLSAEAGEAALLGEVRRNLAVYANQNAQHPVRGLFVADATEAGTVAEQLADKLAIPVRPLDPFADLEAADLPAERPGLFAGAAGLLRAQAAGALPINFVKPREPRAARDPDQLKVAVAVAAAVLVLVGGIVFGWFQLSAKEREIRLLSQQQTDLDLQLGALEDDARRIKAIGDWTGSAVVWLDELYDLTERFPDLKTMRLTGLSGELSTTGQAKGKTQGKITLRGVTSDPKGAQTLADRLAQEGNYSVRDTNVSRNATVDQFKFGQQFVTQVDVEPRPAAKYVRRLPPPLPPRKFSKVPIPDPDPVDPEVPLP